MNKLTMALAVGTLTFGTASAYLMSQLDHAREQAQSLQARITELERLRPASNPFSASPSAPQLPAQVAAPAPTTRPAPARREALAFADEVSSPPPERRPNRPRPDELLHDPEYRKAMLAQQKMALLRMYPDLRSALGLDQAQADALLELLAEQQMNQMSNRPRINRDGAMEEASRQQWQKQMQQMQSEREAQIASLLGENKAQAWKEYQSSLGARMQIRELRTVLAESGAALREDQIQPLVSALAAEQQRFNAETANDPGRRNNNTNTTIAARMAAMEQNLENLERYNQRMHDAAAPYLSSEQLQQFDQLRAQQLEMQRANIRMMQAQQKAAAARGENAPAGMISSTGAFIATP